MITACVICNPAGISTEATCRHSSAASRVALPLRHAIRTSPGGIASHRRLNVRGEIGIQPRNLLRQRRRGARIRTHGDCLFLSQSRKHDTHNGAHLGIAVLRADRGECRREAVDQQARDRLGRLIGAFAAASRSAELFSDRGYGLARRRRVAFRGFLRDQQHDRRAMRSRAPRNLAGEHRVDRLGLRRGFRQIEILGEQRAGPWREMRTRPSSRSSPHPCSRRSRSRPEPPAPSPAPRCRPALRPRRAAAPDRVPPCRPAASWRRDPTCS